MPEVAWLRTASVAAAVVASYGLLLARVEQVTLRSAFRALRSPATT
jgi:hypothetical protein